MTRAAAILRRVRRREGQVIPLVAVSMVVLIGFAALVFDIGRVYVAQEQLQAAVNSAALVAGQDLPNAATAYGAAVSYSGAAGDKNAVGGYQVAAGAPDVTFECVPNANPYTSGSPPTCSADTSPAANCHPTGSQSPTPSGASTCNAVNVTEKATVQTTLGGVLSLPSFTVSASATAAQRGQGTVPINAEVILDNTGSMSSDCTAAVPGITANIAKAEPDKLDCAKSGTQAFLSALDPCATSVTTCGSTTKNSIAAPPELGANVAAPFDEVGLMVIPAIGTPTTPPTATTLAKETDCNASSTFTVSYPPWSDPTTPSILNSDAYIGYEAVGLSSDYRAGDASTYAINSPLTTGPWTTSDVVKAVDWGQCSPQSYPAGTGSNPDGYGLKDIGGVGSYLAGAITEAQYQLQQHTRTGAINVIVIESDGEMNPSTTFSNGHVDTTACTDAYNAAAQAKLAGDTIYTIEYDSGIAPCGPDSGTGANSYYDVPSQLMGAMASSPADAANVNGAGDLTVPFTQVANSIGSSTLIPPCTKAPPACN